MSRLDEVESKIESVDWANDWEGDALALRRLARTLAAEVDARDEVITKLLATARDAQRHDVGACDAYRRACEIAGRTE